MDKWRNKNAVVTGSSSVIGLAILKELVREGVNVVGLARNAEKFQPVIEEMQKAIVQFTFIAATFLTLIRCGKHSRGSMTTLVL